MRVRRACAVIAAAMLCGCASQSQISDTPAVITTRDAQTRATLQQAVSSMIGREVTLADDALTRETTLIIERSAARDPTGRKIEVRETEAPHVLHLVKRAGDCMLVHDSTKRETKLAGVSCRAA